MSNETTDRDQPAIDYIIDEVLFGPPGGGTVYRSDIESVLREKFAAIRESERARCAAIVRRFRLDEHADIMLREIENG